MSDLYGLFESRKRKIRENKVKTQRVYALEILKILTDALKKTDDYVLHEEYVINDKLIAKSDETTSKNVKIQWQLSEGSDTFHVDIFPLRYNSFEIDVDIDLVSEALKKMGYGAISLKRHYKDGTDLDCISVVYDHKLDKEEIKEESVSMEERATEMIRQGESYEEPPFDPEAGDYSEDPRHMMGF